MNLLAKIGGIILKATEILTGFGSVVSQSIPSSSGVITTVSKDLTEIATVITQVEAVGQSLAIAGPDKLKAAAPLVAQVILSSAMIVNHSIADSAKFQGGCTKIADGMADILNSLHG